MVRSATVARGREGLVDQRSFTHRAGALHVSPNRVIANPILLTRQGICCFNTPPTPALTADLGLTGARWGLQGAEAVLELRAIRCNGDWDTYWTYHLAQELPLRRQHHPASGMNSLQRRRTRIMTKTNPRPDVPCLVVLVLSLIHISEPTSPY